MIKTLPASISAVRDLSPTSREITLDLPEALEFQAGAFVNIFVGEGEGRQRRAYSLSSEDGSQKKVSLAIRHVPNGKLSPFFWNPDVVGKKIEVMGPLGLNLAPKITNGRIFLFGFGIGAGVVRSLAIRFASDKTVRELVIAIASRSEDEEVYGDYFRELATSGSKISYRAVFARTMQNSSNRQGYLNNHLDGYRFTNSSVFICGTRAACVAIKDAPEISNAQNVKLFVEDFG